MDLLVNRVRLVFSRLADYLRQGSRKSGVRLSSQQQMVVDLLTTSDDNVFVTGKAGAGKSIVLDNFVRTVAGKAVIKVAPTGIAALHIGGQTIHAAFKIPVGIVRPNDITVQKPTRRLLRAVDIIVIDEISMVRADVIDGMDRTMRLAKGNTSPFGGARVIAFGDLYQLPPVVADEHSRRYLHNEYEDVHFFNAHVWAETTLKVVELRGSFRQSDEQFLSTLNAIRDGSFTDTDIAYLNSRTVASNILAENSAITLTTTIAAAQKINANRLERLRGKTHVYEAIIQGSGMHHASPADVELRLKKGAQIVFIRNDQYGRWVNGDTGTVKRLTGTNIQVVHNGHTYSIEPETWEQTKYVYDEVDDILEQTVTGTFTQFPIRLAWAITIHKSQGQTYDNVIIDVRDGAFAPGQMYVALSRCRSLEGLRLIGELEKEDIIVDPTVSAFMTMMTR